MVKGEGGEMEKKGPGPLIAVNKGKGANVESGCRTSAAHIVAFGELMGFHRSPLELCL